MFQEIKRLLKALAIPLLVGAAGFFYQISHVAGLLNILYLIWLTYAAYLNAGVWFLNR